MARYRYRRRRYYRPRRYYRRRRYGRKKAIINNSSRSRVRIKIKTTQQVSFAFTHGGAGYASARAIFHPFAASTNADFPVSPMAQSLINQTAFTTFANVYDEFKLDFMSVKFTACTPVGVGNFPSLEIVSCWDRHFSNYDFAHSKLTATGQEFYSALEASPSSVKVTAVNNSVAKFIRFIRPSDLSEKIGFAPTNTAAQTITYGKDNPAQVSSYVLSSWYNTTSNPLPSFCPALFLQLKNSSVPGANVTWTFTVQFDCTYVVTFRGPRFGQSSSASTKAAGVIADDSGLGPDGGLSIEPANVPDQDMGSDDDAPSVEKAPPGFKYPSKPKAKKVHPFVDPVPERAGKQAVQKWKQRAQSVLRRADGFCQQFDNAADLADAVTDATGIPEAGVVTGAKAIGRGICRMVNAANKAIGDDDGNVARLDVDDMGDGPLEYVLERNIEDL